MILMMGSRWTVTFVENKMSHKAAAAAAAVVTSVLGCKIQ